MVSGPHGNPFKIVGAPRTISLGMMLKIRTAPNPTVPRHTGTTLYLQIVTAAATDETFKKAYFGGTTFTKEGSVGGEPVRGYVNIERKEGYLS